VDLSLFFVQAHIDLVLSHKPNAKRANQEPSRTPKVTCPTSKVRVSLKTTRRRGRTSGRVFCWGLRLSVVEESRDEPCPKTPNKLDTKKLGAKKSHAGCPP